MTPVPVHRALAGHGCLWEGALGGGWQRREGRQGKSSAPSGLHVVGLIGEFVLSPHTACGCPDIFHNVFNDSSAVWRKAKQRAGHGDAR
jgi:hypothetical protein